jgi:Leucine-rich repeat (LRR) protein
VLDISNTTMTGSIDRSTLPRNITSLRVASNRLSKVDLQGLDALEIVDVSFNPGLSSFPLPPAAGDTSRLHTFAASGCSLTGTIPRAFNASSSPELRTLALSDNRLELPLPSLTQLERLYLAGNPFNESLEQVLRPNMWLPESFDVFEGPRVSLKVLDLAGCNLTGSLWPYMWTGGGGTIMTSLEDLSLSGNPELSGPIPEFYTR